MPTGDAVIDAVGVLGAGVTDATCTGCTGAAGAAGARALRCPATAVTASRGDGVPGCGASGSVVAAGSVVLPGTVLPARSFVAGVPAKPRREVTAEEVEAHRQSAARYVLLGQCHQDRRLLLDKLVGDKQ